MRMNDKIIYTLLKNAFIFNKKPNNDRLTKIYMDIGLQGVHIISTDGYAMLDAVYHFDHSYNLRPMEIPNSYKLYDYPDSRMIEDIAKFEVDEMTLPFSSKDSDSLGVDLFASYDEPLEPSYLVSHTLLKQIGQLKNPFDKRNLQYKMSKWGKTIKFEGNYGDFYNERIVIMPMKQE